jgi:hypothetical protein
MKRFSYNTTGLSPVLKSLTLPRKVRRKKKQEQNRSIPGLYKDHTKITNNNNKHQKL